MSSSLAVNIHNTMEWIALKTISFFLIHKYQIPGFPSAILRFVYSPGGLLFIRISNDRNVNLISQPMSRWNYE
jgi:hypothetical protein